MVEIESRLEGFTVTDASSPWGNYGIEEFTGNFGNTPRMYKVIRIGGVHYVKSPSFIPIPNEVAKAVFDQIKQKYNMETKGVSRDVTGSGKFYGILISNRRKEVEVGDYVAWGVSVENNPLGPFRIRTYLLRLACSNGMTVPEESEQTAIGKSYKIEEMVGNAIGLVEQAQLRFEEKLEFFRTMKRYRLNQELAQILARKFPRPILEPAINVKYEQRVPVVESYARQDLWKTYNDITYNISHRKLKVSTHIEWTSELTAVMRKWISENAGTE